MNTYLNETFYNTLSNTAKNQTQEGTFYIGWFSYGSGFTVTNAKNAEKERTWTGKVVLISISENVYTGDSENCLNT